MALLKVLLLLGLGVSVNSDVFLQKRIIGGHNCDVKERLYHVRLRGTNTTHRQLCGGSLIHPEWILTAASCWKSGWINGAMLKVHPWTAGKFYPKILDNPVVFAPEGWQHDIVLLKLQRRLKNAPLAPLPDCSNRPKIGDTVQLAGEGDRAISPNNRPLPFTTPATRLQCVDMKVVNVSHLLPKYGHVFTTAEPSKDACYGDAGSAVMFNGMIYGVIAPGVPDYTCQNPVSIMDVCEYMEWIKAAIGAK